MGLGPVRRTRSKPIDQFSDQNDKFSPEVLRLDITRPRLAQNMISKIKLNK